MTLLKKVLCEPMFHPEMGGIAEGEQSQGTSITVGLSCSFSEEKGLWGHRTHLI